MFFLSSDKVELHILIESMTFYTVKSWYLLLKAMRGIKTSDRSFFALFNNSAFYVAIKNFLEYEVPLFFSFLLGDLSAFIII